MESGPFPSSRADAFPAGLRVLIVDDDPTWLKILEKMLRKCSYEVTTCSVATEALEMLRERKDRFDIVISDVNMPDMDGFKLLEHVGLEMDLPVIMMSIDGETSRVMKGVQHGACDYLLKPVRMKELRNIWQHVYRKKMHELKEMEVHNIHEEFNILKNGYEDLEDSWHLIGGTEMNSARKRKDADNQEFGDQDFSDPSTVKKARVVWSVDLHQKFVDAVNQIGFDKVGPKKILDLMNVPGLTRENVASHLQKYRLYLSRIQKQNEGRTCNGNMPSDLINNDNGENFGLYSASNIQEDMELTKYMCATENFQAQGIVPNSHTNETKRKHPVQGVGNKKNLSSDTCNQKANNVPQLGVLLSFKGMMPSIKGRSCDPVTPKHKPLHDATARMQFLQYTEQENCSKFSDYSRLSNLDQDHPSLFDHLSSPLPSVISSTCTDEKDLCEMKHFLADYRNGHFTTIPPMTCMIDSMSLQVKHGIVNAQDIGAICKLDGPPSIEGCYLDEPYKQGCFPLTCEFSLKSGAENNSFPDDLHLCSIQKIGCFENVSISGSEIYQYIDSTLTTEVQSNWNAGSELHGEYFNDPVDYPPMDEFLFA